MCVCKCGINLLTLLALCNNKERSLYTCDHELHTICVDGARSNSPYYMNKEKENIYLFLKHLDYCVPQDRNLDIYFLYYTNFIYAPLVIMCEMIN